MTSIWAIDESMIPGSLPVFVNIIVFGKLEGGGVGGVVLKSVGSPTLL